MNLESKMERVINGSYKNMTGILVRKNNSTVYERYYNGCSAENKIHVASVTKSIMSALFGIAIDQGYIKSVDQKVLEFFPDYQIPKGEKTIQQVTIQDMLMMTAPYKYKSEPYQKVMSGEHWTNDALNLLGGKRKSGEFIYSAMIGTHLLSGILVKATEQSVLEFARKNLFDPLEIELKGDISLCSEEANLEFLKATDRNGWVVDPEGVNTAAWGITLTPMDMAKIGELYLKEGLWNGRQLISKEWITKSTKVHSKWGKLLYGYLWWIMDESEHSYAALGQGGNVIYVNAKKELVVAITSLYKDNAQDRMVLIKKYIEPMVEKN
ncbi:MAG: serine hydrolase [bacterium]|nr:serine hydrolase [bacterium]